MNKSLMVLLILLVCCWTPPAIAAEQLVVVVHKNNPTEQMARSEIIDLFMGKYIAFPNGTQAQPVELDDEQAIKKQFYAQLVGMSLARINAYWSRIRFTGRTRTAIEQKNIENVIKFISQGETAIGYIPRSMLNDNLKVVFSLNE
jgi:ABC-type phosphate transport system substrate-binding protein